MTKVTVWHGTDQDLRRLQNAVNRNCTCPDQHVTCPAHLMLLDQTTLDHLAFIAAQRNVYRKAEFDPASEWF